MSMTLTKIKNCEICDKEFTKNPKRDYTRWEATRFCSKDCRNIWRSTSMTGESNPMFGKTHTSEALEKNRIANTGTNHYNWQGGIIVDKDGYIQVWVGKDHPMANIHGYCRQHRLVMADAIGRHLTAVEVVHHMEISEGGSGRKDDNRLENLMLFTNDSEHQKHHHALELVAA